MTAETTYASAVVNIITTGIGLGITMPLYTIAVQNAVPYNVLGVATSSTAFFRSIGGSVGLAVLGSVMNNMNNRFVLELTNKLPDAVKAAIPAGQLNALVKNPQALMSPEAQARLQGLFGQMNPQGGELFQRVLQVLREALGSALSQVFLFALLFVVIAFLINYQRDSTPQATYITGPPFA
jgi:hypothetical protein